MTDSELTGPTRPLPNLGWWRLFERSARRQPDLTALVAEDGSWTFGQLDADANRLARLIQEATGSGPGTALRPGTVVACALERTGWSVVTALAVAKAGGVHLALEAGSPARRTATVLADADPALLLTDQADLAAQAAPGLPTLVLGDWQPALAGYPAQPPKPVTNAGGRPAYLVYTSGSTGRPKGVLVANHSLVNVYQELAARYFPLAWSGPGGRPVRVAHGLARSFDAAWNPLLWLAGGHQVHLLSEETRSDPDRYLGTVRDRGLTVVEAVPPAVHALVEAGLLTGPSRPRLLLMGGEAVPAALWSRLRATPGLTTVNLYGPTECTVFATAARADGEDGSPEPLIGRPIGNVRARVVDERAQPVPVGAVGELLLGGACLAEGYLGRPELTAERFVELDGRRWYRTGDRCRVRAEGGLEFLGRLDEQVKIRGHRCEPGEAEHLLLADPRVAQAAVRAEGAPGDQRLVAYVVPGADAPDLAGLLRTELRTQLPDYLVPARIELVPAMPLGPNGKIDRTALSGQSAAPTTAPPLTPPRSAAERLVAAAWSATLGLEAAHAPDVHADFFDLGGHSLLAAQLAARLRAAGLECSLRDVLRHPTIAALAALVGDAPIPFGKDP